MTSQHPFDLIATNPNADSTQPDVARVKAFLLQLQANICQRLEAVEASIGGTATFAVDEWERQEGGGGRSNVLQNGKAIEKGGVMFSHIRINQLPASATERHPHIVGAPAEALGVSVVIHPSNPHAPTSHANIRLFVAYPSGGPAVWWMGGGFDLTPIYAYPEDCRAWHQAAFDLCKPFGDLVYPTYKAWCDKYFYLPHRKEQRGIGGLFYDDLNTGDFEQCFSFMQAVGNGYINTLEPILVKRINHPFTPAQRDFQLYRRGRYVEYNLVYDRGTLFGLQTGGRIESILVSLPNMVSWHYRFEPELSTAESRLTREYLVVRDWL